MNNTALHFLKSLLSVPTPSGWEAGGQQLVAEYVAPFADAVRYDTHGNLHAVLNPDAPVRIMLDGHCDEIGLIVQHIDKEGFVYVAALGGVNLNLLPGERILFQGPQGPVPGVIGVKAPHLMSPEERNQPVKKISDLPVDIGAQDRAQALEALEIGSVATIDAGWRPLLGDRVSARGMDDRVGAFIVAEALRRAAGHGVNVAVHMVSSVQEEIGRRGGQTAAFGIDPHAGIAAEVTFASDDPGGNAKISGEVKLGKGPNLHRGPNINPVLQAELEKVAKAQKIPFQITAEPRATGTDANAMQLSRGGVAATLVSIPNRYMHTPVEMISLKDLDAIEPHPQFNLFLVNSLFVTQQRDLGQTVTTHDVSSS